MSEKTYTEREVVMRERAAFVEGARRFPQFDMNAEQLAAEAYPLPKRRKVVEVEGTRYRLSEDGKRLEFDEARIDETPMWCGNTALRAYGDAMVLTDLVVRNCRAIVALNGQVWEDDA